MTSLLDKSTPVPVVKVFYPHNSTPKALNSSEKSLGESYLDSTGSGGRKVGRSTPRSLKQYTRLLLLNNLLLKEIAKPKLPIKDNFLSPRGVVSSINLHPEHYLNSSSSYKGRLQAKFRPSRNNQYLPQWRPLNHTQIPESTHSKQSKCIQFSGISPCANKTNHDQGLKL